MSEFFASVVGMLVVGLIGIWAGGSIARTNVATDCQKIGATIINGGVYDCKRRPDRRAGASDDQ